MVSQFPLTQSIIALKPSPPPPAPAAKGDSLFGSIGLYSTLLMTLIAAGIAAYAKLMILDKKNKEIKFEQYKSQDLQKRLKLALKTIDKMEKNPDLIHSREFNLDYLRLRMDEEVFHYAIINQIKIRVKQIISVALRPNTAHQQVGVAATGRQVDEMFDVTYETDTAGKRTTGVLFRVQIRLMKLPTQSTSSTIAQIIDCIEKFLSPAEDHENWQPTIQGRVVLISWDQKAKPTPLLVLEQSGEGVNVSFRTNPNKRQVASHPAPPPPPPASKAPKSNVKSPKSKTLR
ncbi:hypothetical protein [Oscillatoria sp. FACHB-1406]|uniref:hypothetical protein n=1 Tax=Oscillatoria sp. FACHB-1406 TaxID=2692846 RepID=UPI001688B0C4|nr:hypothetical protein [Oscillatoria sp. FACHB-1406]MBD2576335.1 hypothetical protein [Oscillatoria sp. FACHB-1406]